MARKNLLKGLMEAPGPDAARPVGTPETPALVTKTARPGGPARGAIGAVSQTIADLKARAVIDLDPHLITAGGLPDRLEDEAEADALLRRSIAEHGQQVPVLVRPHPEEEGRFQVVYGRRRVLAARDLGIPVKAMVRRLDDTALVLAQGQENSARRNLSFIERAHFARELAGAGYDRAVIADALSIDRSEISRLLSVAERIPTGVLYAIGAAPSIGRARWLAFADLMEKTGYTEAEAVLLAHGPTSDARFEALVKAMSLPERRAREAAEARARRRRPVTRTLTAADGSKLGQAKIDPDKTVLRLPAEDGFADWLVANLAELHRRWQSGG